MPSCHQHESQVSVKMSKLTIECAREIKREDGDEPHPVGRNTRNEPRLEADSDSVPSSFLPDCQSHAVYVTVGAGSMNDERHIRAETPSLTTMFEQEERFLLERRSGESPPRSWTKQKASAFCKATLCSQGPGVRTGHGQRQSLEDHFAMWHGLPFAASAFPEKANTSIPLWP